MHWLLHLNSNCHCFPWYFPLADTPKWSTDYVTLSQMFKTNKKTHEHRYKREKQNTLTAPAYELRALVFVSNLTFTLIFPLPWHISFPCKCKQRCFYPSIIHVCTVVLSTVFHWLAASAIQLYALIRFHNKAQFIIKIDTQ